MYVSTTDNDTLAIDVDFQSHQLPDDSDVGERSLAIYKLTNQTPSTERHSRRGSGILTLNMEHQSNKGRRPTIPLQTESHSAVAHHLAPSSPVRSVTILSRQRSPTKAQFQPDREKAPLNAVLPTRKAKCETRKVYAIETIADNDFQTLRNTLSTRLPSLTN